MKEKTNSNLNFKEETIMNEVINKEKPQFLTEGNKMVVKGKANHSIAEPAEMKGMSILKSEPRAKS